MGIISVLFPERNLNSIPTSLCTCGKVYTELGPISQTLLRSSQYKCQIADQGIYNQPRLRDTGRQGEVHNVLTPKEFGGASDFLFTYFLRICRLSWIAAVTCWSDVFRGYSITNMLGLGQEYANIAKTWFLQKSASWSLFFFVFVSCLSQCDLGVSD